MKRRKKLKYGWAWILGAITTICLILLSLAIWNDLYSWVSENTKTIYWITIPLLSIFVISGFIGFKRIKNFLKERFV